MKRKPWNTPVSQLLGPEDLQKHFFFRLKGTNKYYHHTGEHFEFRESLNGACIFDAESCEKLKYMLATEETELVKASDVLPIKS
jgi:hypothetical protein